MNVLTEFVEAAFHMILYLRNIYPRELFKEVKKYDVLLYQSRSPALNEYLGKVSASVGDELSKGTLQRVALVVKTADMQETPLERIVFDFDWLIPPGKQPDINGDWTPITNGLPKSQLEDHLRGFLLKLSVADTYLTRLPEKVTFAVAIELKDGSPRPQSDAARKGEAPAEWVPIEESEMSRKDAMNIDSENASDGVRAQAHLKTTRLGIINVQMVVQEFDAKFDTDGEDMRQAEEQRRIGRDRKGKGRAA